MSCELRVLGFFRLVSVRDWQFGGVGWGEILERLIGERGASSRGPSLRISRGGFE